MELRSGRPSSYGRGVPRERRRRPALQVRVDIVHLAQGELDRFIDALALAEPDATRGPPRWRR